MFYRVAEEAEADGREVVARLAEERKLQLVAEAKELKRKHNRQQNCRKSTGSPAEAQEKNGSRSRIFRPKEWHPKVPLQSNPQKRAVWLIFRGVGGWWWWRLSWRGQPGENERSCSFSRGVGGGVGQRKVQPSKTSRYARFRGSVGGGCHGGVNLPKNEREHSFSGAVVASERS
jgi:hypothetical protein